MIYKKIFLFLSLMFVLVGCAIPEYGDKYLKNTNLFNVHYNQNNDTLNYYINIKLENYCYDFQMDNKVYIDGRYVVLNANITFYDGLCAQSIKTVKIKRSLIRFKKKYAKVKNVKLCVYNIHTNKKRCYVSSIEQ